ncbi:MAG: 23S rRNA (uracil(1939)-C(5))-methyltransferase RlmD [Chlamydiales bacterium]|nr:23S rRNA (uracil(1939)-C(5))-methyltransferase RlmD [Chlamydiales bacterium]
MEIETLVELTVERLGINGEGVARLDGYTIFVDGALPGEKVKARFYEKRKSFGRAKIVQILERSPHRIKPICPLFGRCGGCQLMHLDYAEQLKMKRQKVVDALERIGKIFDIDVCDCSPSPQPLAYRNKIQLPLVDGRLGLYARSTHDLIEIDGCFIHCALGERIFKGIRRMITCSSAASEIRHVIIKTAVHTEQALVILVTMGRASAPLKQLASEILKFAPEIKGVVQNINPAEGNVILGEEFVTLAGEGWIEERLADLSFIVSPASFFQVNPAQAERLYQQVIDFADLKGDERVLDAYCGVGTLSLVLAKQAKEVIGVESVAEAVSDAVKNAERNGISNARFVCDQAENFIATLKEIDLAILNPPRKGCEASLLQKLLELKPKRVIYVSCDPATLARDLQLLSSGGYQIETVQPFDMFPQTAHVESVVSLRYS